MTAIVTLAPESSVRGDQPGEREIRQRIAVDQQERRARSVGKERQRPPRAARRSQDRLLPRVADPHIEVGAIAEHRSNGRRTMVQVHDDVTNVVASEPSDHSP